MSAEAKMSYSQFLQRCRDIVDGRLPATPEQRNAAKAGLYHERYGTGPQKMQPTRFTCVHAHGCPFTSMCAAEGHCDAKFNGYR